MVAAEQRQLHYLTKLRLTKNVKRLIDRLIVREHWVDVMDVEIDAAFLRYLRHLFSDSMQRK